MNMKIYTSKEAKINNSVIKLPSAIRNSGEQKQATPGDWANDQEWEC